MILKLFQIVPYPHPQRQQESPARGKQIEKNQFSMFIFLFNKKVKNAFVRYCLKSKGVLTKTTGAVFPRGSEKRKSNNDDKHDHDQEKRRPSTYIEETNKCWKVIFVFFVFRRLLKAFNVNVTVSCVIFHVRNFNLGGSKEVRRGLGRPNYMCKTVYAARYRRHRWSHSYDGHSTCISLGSLSDFS